jgi:DNA-binding NarL/FixJ family response regulator
MRRFDARPSASTQSERQSDVSRLVSGGLADKEIARRLGISVTTVRSHIDCIFRKLDVHTRAQLAHRLDPGSQAGSLTRCTDAGTHPHS